MSLYIIRTIFKGIKTPDTHGFRFFNDENEKHYYNLLTEEDLKKEGLEFLKIIKNLDDEKLNDLLLDVHINEEGIFIDDVFFDYPEIEKIIEPKPIKNSGD